MKELLEKVLSFDVMAVIVALNIFLSGLYSAIDKLRDVIPGDESKVLSGIKWVLDLFKKIIDLVGMNKQHK